jgi:hypothetical protein
LSVVASEPNVPSSYAGHVAQALRQEAAASIPEIRVHATRRTAAFHELATHVESLGVTDPLLRTLASVRIALTGSRTPWGPSPKQAKFCSLLGLSGPTPGAAEELLHELVALGVADLPPLIGAANDRAQIAEAKAAKLEAATAKVSELKAEVKNARGAAEAERSATRAAAGERDRFKSLWESAASGKPASPASTNGGVTKPKAEKKPRRKVVKGFTGVYSRPGTDNLEISYKDTADKLRWSSLTTSDPEEAAKEREKRVAEVERLKFVRSA